MEMYYLPTEHQDEYLLPYADVFRHARLFEKLIDKHRVIWLPNEKLRKILVFEYVREEK